MGRDLQPKPGGVKGPTFAVWALKDPESGNLDRIQIIKGFINKWGRPAEKIYDVAWSDNRKPDPKTGELPPVGNTVDVKTAKYTNDIGDSQLSAVWINENDRATAISTSQSSASQPLLTAMALTIRPNSL